MHKYITLFFLVMPLLFACSGEKTDTNVIGHEEMVSILTDVHIADGRLFNIDPNPDSLYKFGTGAYIALFKRHHTDSAQFKRSFKYYTGQPAELLAMYDQVLFNIKVKTDSLSNLFSKQHALPKK